MPTDLTLFDSTMQEHLKRVSERIAGLAVVDQQSYITAGQALNDARAIVKEWEKQADAEIDPIKSNLDRARNKWKTYIEPGKTLIKALADRLNLWKEEERKAAQREQDKINEKARKEARDSHAKTPTPIEVKPAIPSVAGIRNQICYYAELQDADKIIDEFISGKPIRRAFLRQFITINEAALGKFARDTKDSEKAASLVPGVKFTQRG